METRNIPNQIADFSEAITNSQLFNEQTFSYVKLCLYLFFFQFSKLEGFFLSFFLSLASSEELCLETLCSF